jgi:hypothetical protein
MLWKRFHNFVLELLPKRKAIIAMDTTGYSRREIDWKEASCEV